jgi:hypothetical protein
MLRSVIAVVIGILMVSVQVLAPAFGQTIPAAQTASQNNASFDAIFKAFPSGGEPLSMRIADLIVANPKLAPELVAYLQSTQGLNRAQKLAAEHGIAAAADRLGINAQEVGGFTEAEWAAFALILAAIGIGVGVAASHHNNNNNPVVIPSATSH